MMSPKVLSQLTAMLPESQTNNKMVAARKGRRSRRARITTAHMVTLKIRYDSVTAVS